VELTRASVREVEYYAVGLNAAVYIAADEVSVAKLTLCTNNSAASLWSLSGISLSSTDLSTALEGILSKLWVALHRDDDNN
jgi:hypothetical protein